MKARLMILFFGIFFSLALQAQFTCNIPRERVSFKICPDEINVVFEKNYEISERNDILSLFSNDIEPLSGKESATHRFSRIKLKRQFNQQELLELSTRVSGSMGIAYASPVLVYHDKIKAGMTNQILVRLKQATDYEKLNECCIKLGLTKLNMASDFRIRKINQEDNNKTVIVEIPKDKIANGIEMVDHLQQTGLFEYVEMNFIQQMSIFTVDPLLTYQHSLTQMNVTGVWSSWSSVAAPIPGDNVKVAIIDVGVQTTHPDLLGNMALGYDATYGTYSPAQQTVANSNGGSTYSTDGHGTICAGVVAAVKDNNEGIAGIAPGSTILPIRIGYNTNSTTGTFYSDNYIMADGINMAVYLGADILSCSWGGGVPSFSIEAGINNALWSGRSGHGSPVFFATGNDNSSTVSWPASYEGCIAVGATNNDPTTEHRCSPTDWGGTSGSNYGSDLDICAPGLTIVTTDLTGADGFNNDPSSAGDYFFSAFGTSMACPNAAGVMALILSAFPATSESDARKAIEATCDKVGGYSYTSTPTLHPNGTWTNNTGYGRVNALNALNYVSGNINSTTTGGPISVTVTVPATSCLGNDNHPKIHFKVQGGTPIPNTGACGGAFPPSWYAYQVEVFQDAACTILTDHFSTDPVIFQNASTFLATDGAYYIKDIYLWSTTDPATSFPLTKTYYLKVTDFNCSTNAYVSHVNVQSFSITLNRAPDLVLATSVNACEGSNPNIGAGNSLLYGTAPFTSEWHPSGAVIPNPSQIFDGTVINAQTNGVYTFTVTDGAGCITSENISLTVSHVTAHAGADISACLNASVPLQSTAATGGIGTVTYSWSPPTGLSDANTLTPNIVLNTPGIFTYTLSATDAAGCTNNDNVNVSVGSASLGVNAGPDLNVCNSMGQSVNAVVSGGSGNYAYQWTNASTGATVSTVNPFVFTTGSASVTYTITVTDLSTGCMAQDQFIVNVSTSNLTITGAPGGYVTCPGGSGVVLNDYTVTGGTPPYSYVWSPATGLDNPTIAYPTANPSTATSYRVYITDATGCTHNNWGGVVDTYTAAPELFPNNLFPTSACVTGTNVTAWQTPLNTYCTIGPYAGVNNSNGGHPSLVFHWSYLPDGIPTNLTTTDYSVTLPWNTPGTKTISVYYNTQSRDFSGGSAVFSTCLTSPTITKTLFIEPAQTYHNTILFKCNSLQNTIADYYNGIRLGMSNSSTYCSAYLNSGQTGKYEVAFDKLDMVNDFLADYGSDFLAEVNTCALTAHMDVYATEDTIAQNSGQSQTDQFIQEVNDYKLIPNPSTGKFSIEFNHSLSEKVEINLYNSSGQMVTMLYSGKPDNNRLNFDLNTSDIENGLYLIRIISNSIQSSQQLIISK